MSRMRLAVIALLRAVPSERAESDGILAIFATLVEGSEDSACTVQAGAGYTDPVMLQIMPPSKSDVGNGGPRLADTDEERQATRYCLLANPGGPAQGSGESSKAIMGHSPGDVTEGYVHPPLSELRAVLIAAEREMLRWAADTEARQAMGEMENERETHVV
jgi:hypothetical protein